MPADPVLIRKAAVSDAATAAELITQLGYPTSVQEMEARLETVLSHAEHCTLVAELDGRVIGLIGLDVYWAYERSGLQGRILVLTVDQEFRNQGVGAALVAEAELWFQEAGARTSLVTSRNTRLDAHRFYRRLGYEENGVRFFKSLPERDGGHEG